MKKKYSLLSMVFFITVGFAQTKQSEKADKLFETYQYVDAIEAYLKLVENNKASTYVYKKLADSYYNVYNVEEASKWYAKSIETDQDAETYYRYAQTLKSKGQYELANKQMDKFAQLSPKDQRAVAHLENPNYIPELADQSKLFDVEEININNSEQSDFGAILSNDNVLYFVSSRNTNKKEDSWTNQPYLDIYKSIRNADGSLTEPEEVIGLNTPYHDGPITLNNDGKTLIFARDGHSSSNYKKLKNKKVKLAQQGLYKATLLGGKWVDVQPLPLNSKDYSVSHPSLSSDGKTLYFASNMPGGYGETDLWKVSVNGDNYGEPENLGPNVNTAGREGFPFITQDNVLYFASSGKQGFGGFDVFKVDLNTNEDAVNLGKGINTKSDDFSFSIKTSKNIGYFSSNRSGVDNIYGALPICQYEIFAIVSNADTNTKIKNATVILLDANNNSVATQKTSNVGETDFNVKCENKYVLNISKEGYKTASFPVKPDNGNDVTVNAQLQPINEMITETEVKLDNIYFEFDKSNITKQGAFELDKLVQIMKDRAEMKILVRSHTDTKGSASYNLKLSDRRAQATMQYLISKGISKNRLSAKGLGSSAPKVDCGFNCTDKQDAQNRRSEFLIVND